MYEMRVSSGSPVFGGRLSDPWRGVGLKNEVMTVGITIETVLDLDSTN